MGLEAGNPVFGGTVLRRAAIRSPNFAHKVAGWNIGQDGSAEFNNVIIRDGQVISGTALYYNGTPAAGNLLESIAVSAGTDDSGNAFLAGFTTYLQSGGTTFAINQNGFSWALLTAPAIGGPFATIGSISGLLAGDMQLVPSRSLIVQAALGPRITSALLDIQGTLAGKSLDYAPAGAAPPTGPAGTEPWNYVGAAGQPAFGTGWSNFGGGFANLAFKLVASPPRSVWINGEVTHTATAAQTIFTLPAAYRPVSNQQFICITNASGVVGVEVSSAGLVELLVAPAAIATHNVDILFSLDI